jgi:hypothetical protein
MKKALLLSVMVVFGFISMAQNGNGNGNNSTFDVFDVKDLKSAVQSSPGNAPLAMQVLSSNGGTINLYGNANPSLVVVNSQTLDPAGNGNANSNASVNGYPGLNPQGLIIMIFSFNYNSSGDVIGGSWMTYSYVNGALEQGNFVL